jgi:hypothetical protein
MDAVVRCSPYPPIIPSDPLYGQLFLRYLSLCTKSVSYEKKLYFSPGSRMPLPLPIPPGSNERL